MPGHCDALADVAGKPAELADRKPVLLPPGMCGHPAESSGRDRGASSKPPPLTPDGARVYQVAAALPATRLVQHWPGVLRSRRARRDGRVAGGQPCPRRIGAIRLTIAETARIERLARQYAAGLITRARIAFCLRWSRWRRRHQARARWRHYSTRLLAAAAT